PQTIRRVPNEDVEWVEACKGGPKALSNFGHSGPFTETILLGNLAIRLGKKIEWDGPNMRALNAPEAEPLIRRAYRRGWEI
ncbi:MAG: Gfo/Idh/MocA family oxidoreductase, partial [Verrucomicrobiales bacterium]